MTPAKKLKDLLLARVPTFEAGGYKLMVGEFSTSQDRCVVFYDVGGRSPEANVLVDYPTVQVIARGNAAADSYPATYVQLELVSKALLGIPSGSVVYPELTSCTQRGHIQRLGKDDNGRHLFSLNFQLITEPSEDPVGHRVSL